jgi:hypothetical protein
MNVEAVRSYVIESEADADYYLTSLFEKPEYRSMDEAHIRAAHYIKDEHLKNYFINKAKALLQV